MATAATDLFACYTLLVWLLSQFTVADASDVCSYMTYGYNEYDRRHERMISFKSCQWGCCWKYTDPCCGPPLGLIVGCVVGGFVCFLLIAVSICCCCCCDRNRDNTQRRGGMVVRYPHHAVPGTVSISVVGGSSSSAAVHDPHNAISTSLPPGVYQPPPSYEEVMAGEVNSAYKADSDSSPPHYRTVTNSQ